MGGKHHPPLWGHIEGILEIPLEYECPAMQTLELLHVGRQQAISPAASQPSRSSQEQAWSSQEQLGAAQQHLEQPGGLRTKPEQPGAAQERPAAAKSSHVQPGAAQEQEGAARGCPGAAGRSSEQSGGTRSSQSSQPATSIPNPSASHQPANQLATQPASSCSRLLSSGSVPNTSSKNPQQRTLQ